MMLKDGSPLCDREIQKKASESANLMYQRECKIQIVQLSPTDYFSKFKFFIYYYEIFD